LGEIQEKDFEYFDEKKINSIIALEKQKSSAVTSQHQSL
jgi:hypothetical protein